MYLVERTLHPPEKTAVIRFDATLVKLFRSLATPQDGLEHVHVSARPDRVYVTIFVQATDRGDAVRCADALCRHVLSATPMLAGWTLFESAVES